VDVERKLGKRMNPQASADGYRLRDFPIGVALPDGPIRYQNDDRIQAEGVELEINGPPANWLEATASSVCSGHATTPSWKIRRSTSPSCASRFLSDADSISATGCGFNPRVGRLQETPYRRYQLKAVLLFNFAKFIEWPPQAFGDEHDPFSICVWGDNPFGVSLDEAVRGKTAANRPISIRPVSSGQQARTCQILFVSASARRRMRGILEALTNCCVLTVGDTEDFTENGGIVQFRMKDARVRIEIDAEAAGRTNLRIGSKLLSLAEPARH
jgi:hypothetical protein